MKRHVTVTDKAMRPRKLHVTNIQTLSKLHTAEHTE